MHLLTVLFYRNGVFQFDQALGTRKVKIETTMTRCANIRSSRANWASSRAGENKQHMQSLITDSKAGQLGQIGYGNLDSVATSNLCLSNLLHGNPLNSKRVNGAQTNRLDRNETAISLHREEDRDNKRATHEMCSLSERPDGANGKLFKNPIKCKLK